jgi:hypothetical protein
MMAKEVLSNSQSGDAVIENDRGYASERMMQLRRQKKTRGNWMK